MLPSRVDVTVNQAMLFTVVKSVRGYKFSGVLLTLDSREPGAIHNLVEAAIEPSSTAADFHVQATVNLPPGWMMIT